MDLLATSCVLVLITLIVGTCTMEVSPPSRVALESDHLEIPPAIRELSNKTVLPVEHNKMQTNSSNELISENISNHTSNAYDDDFGDGDDDLIGVGAIRTVLG